MDCTLQSNLCKTFSNGKVMQHVLRNLNIEIKEGDFTVIMGSSGSGKSTLLYTLSGMDTPSMGNVWYGQEDIAKYSNDKRAVFRREHCGFIFQQMYLSDTMSVMDNILVCGLLTKKKPKEVAQRAKELLEAVGLSDGCYNKFPSQLSGGEAQRVAIVRSLINQPQIIFADEPTGALNSTHATQVLDVLTTVNEKGQSIIMVTHDQKTARRANRILYLKDGVIIDELTLGKYKVNDTKRHELLQQFLVQMGW